MYLSLQMGFFFRVFCMVAEPFRVPIAAASATAEEAKEAVRDHDDGAAIGFVVATWLLFLASASGVKEGGPLPLHFSHPFTPAAGSIVNVWVEPKPGAAAVPGPAGGAAAAAGVGGAAPAAGSVVSSPRERFRGLLAGTGMDIDEAIMTTIVRSGSLSTRAIMVQTTEDAVSVYVDASHVPRTKTRAAARQQGIIIDGDMFVPGAQTAMFFYAFKHNVPHVFKVPAHPAMVEKECALWLDVQGAAASAAEVCLVPVEQVVLREGARHAVETGVGSVDVTLLRQGILMPAYAGTIERFPPPIDVDFAFTVIKRIEPTLRFVHASGWLHGDVKPSNIFLDYAGKVWLGDYGTSVPIADADHYSGGTPAFQCEDLQVRAGHESLLRFDLTGLAISVLVLLGLLNVQHAPSGGWPRAALNAPLQRVEDPELCQQLTALLQG